MQKTAMKTLETVRRFRLARLPTPLHEAPRLRAALGGERRCPRILLKRDDLTDLVLGGNKARKLEFLVGEALEQRATVLITSGDLQSNHARMTAAAAAQAGMRSVLVLSTSAEDGMADPRGNLLLDRLLGATVHVIEGGSDKTATEREGARISQAVEELTAAGERPLVIALGGSSGTGALGYVDAVRETVAQLRELGCSPSHLYYASGSRGTQAGLELGTRLFAAGWRCVGIAVSGGEAEKRERAVRIAAEAAARLGVDAALSPDELLTDQDYYGDGYAIPTAACMDAIRLVARTEGVMLDPVYTAKGMAGLIDHIRQGRINAADTVLFLHTGGAPGLFGARDLARWLD